MVSAVIWPSAILSLLQPPPRSSSSVPQFPDYSRSVLKRLRHTAAGAPQKSKMRIKVGTETAVKQQQTGEGEITYRRSSRSKPEPPSSPVEQRGERMLLPPCSSFTAGYRCSRAALCRITRLQDRAAGPTQLARETSFIKAGAVLLLTPHQLLPLRSCPPRLPLFHSVAPT